MTGKFGDASAHRVPVSGAHDSDFSEAKRVENHSVGTEAETVGQALEIMKLSFSVDEEAIILGLSKSLEHEFQAFLQRAGGGKQHSKMAGCKASAVVEQQLRKDGVEKWIQQTESAAGKDSGESTDAEDVSVLRSYLKQLLMCGKLCKMRRGKTTMITH